VTTYLTALGAVAAVHLAATAIPGPTNLVVISAAVSRTRRAGLATTLGVAGGDVVWAVAAMAGLSVVLSTLTWLAAGLRLAGGAFLIYLGVRAWLAARTPLPDDAQPAPQDLWRAVRTGLVTNLTNPKSVVFFGSVFAATLPANAPAWVRAAAVAVVAANALAWHATLSAVFSLRRAHRAYGRAKAWVDRITGGLLTAFGVGLIHEALLDGARSARASPGAL
jgi:RhtB (resistance to homoserine/threonine) family protein